MDKDANSEILAQSEFTVKVAKKELNQTLDYSTDSFKALEALIQHIKNHIVSLKSEGKPTEQTIQRASVSIGGYLGEVVRRHHGGNWVAKNAVMKTLVINGQEFSPILYIFQRLAKDSGFSLENYWADIHQKLYPTEKIEDKPPVLKTPNTLTGNKRIIIGGIIGIVVLCFTGILAVAIYSNIKITNKFRTQLDTFLAEAERLDLMTEQGVSYQEFRTQLIEVKATYASIDTWPSAYRDEKLAFDKAIEGWDLTLDVWEIKLGLNKPGVTIDMPVGVYLQDSLIDYWSQYAGVDLAKGRSLSADEWIGGLMGKASTYLSAGKAGVK